MINTTIHEWFLWSDQRVKEIKRIVTQSICYRLGRMNRNKKENSGRQLDLKSSNNWCRMNKKNNNRQRWQLCSDSRSLFVAIFRTRYKVIVAVILTFWIFWSSLQDSQGFTYGFRPRIEPETLRSVHQRYLTSIQHPKQAIGHRCTTWTTRSDLVTEKKWALHQLTPDVGA